MTLECQQVPSGSNKVPAAEFDYLGRFSDPLSKRLFLFDAFESELRFSGAVVVEDCSFGFDL